MDDPQVSSRILTLLDGERCPYEVIGHESAATAREAADARGTALEEGTKAILLKYDDQFGIFALNATRQIRSAKIRRGLKVRRTRFASLDELQKLTGLLPGAVPPFGEPVLPFPLFVDPTAIEKPSMIFTAGSRTTSIRISTLDYSRIVDPHVFSFVR